MNIIFIFQLVKWEPPIRANGKLTKYIIQCSIIGYDETLLKQRNHCNRSKFGFSRFECMIKYKSVFIAALDADNLSIIVSKQDQNSGDENGPDKSMFSEDDVQQAIDFEDELHNTIYTWYVRDNDQVYCIKRLIVQNYFF